MSPVENDCEDQGFTRIEDGCFNWQCMTTSADGSKMLRRSLLVRDGYWVCPLCGGSYGEAKEES